MEELIYYICGNIDHNNRAIRTIKKKLKTQVAFNKSITVTYLILCGAIGVLKLEGLERSAEIKKLSEEVEELKRKKGE